MIILGRRKIVKFKFTVKVGKMKWNEMENEVTIGRGEDIEVVGEEDAHGRQPGRLRKTGYTSCFPFSVFGHLAFSLS